MAQPKRGHLSGIAALQRDVKTIHAVFAKTSLSSHRADAKTVPFGGIDRRLNLEQHDIRTRAIFDWLTKLNGEALSLAEVVDGNWCGIVPASAGVQEPGVQGGIA